MQKGMLSQYIAPMGHPKMKIQSSVNHHYLNTGLHISTKSTNLTGKFNNKTSVSSESLYILILYHGTKYWQEKNFNPTQLCRVHIPPSHSVSTSESLSISNCYFHQLVPATCHSHIKYGNNDNNFHYNQ